MVRILEFKRDPECIARLQRERDGQSVEKVGEIVIFPGVRIERDSCVVSECESEDSDPCDNMSEDVVYDQTS